MRRAIVWLIILALLVVAFLFARDFVRRHPQDVPWTELSLRDPIGMFTLRKLSALRDDPTLCRGLLADYGSNAIPAPDKREGDRCGYADGMSLANGDGTIELHPPGVITSCPMAAAMTLYEREVLQPAAVRHFRTRVTGIDHAGSYSCRRLYGRGEGPFSEHATANAFDVVGFRLSDGRRVSVVSDWASSGPKAAFLRDVRNGGCKLFATVLSPDYNAAHADHLHLDHAKRGRTGRSLCR